MKYYLKLITDKLLMILSADVSILMGAAEFGFVEELILILPINYFFSRCEIGIANFLFLLFLMNETGSNAITPTG